MRLGIISDTHDRLAAVDLALTYFADANVDMVIHCGDWKSLSAAVYLAEQAAKLSLPVRGVLGNNDLDVDGFLHYALVAPGDFMLTQHIYELPLESDKQLAAYHGHHRPTLRKVLANEANTIVLLGHSHKPKIERVGDKLLVNPGSTAFSIPRSKTWGPSVAVLDTNNLNAEIIYLT